MAVTAVEPLSNITTSTIVTAAALGAPGSDLAQAVLGQAGGIAAPDTNNGDVLVPRLIAGGWLGYTNADGNTQYNGAAPFSLYDTASAHLVVVPVGQQMVITGFLIPQGASVPANSTIVANGVTIASVGSLALGGPGYLPMFMPLILDQGWSLQVPKNVAAVGYLVNRDSAVSPVIKLVTSGATYTVTTNKTLWLLGAVNTSTTVCNLSISGVAFIAIGAAGANGNNFLIGNGSLLPCAGGYPVQSGQVLGGSTGGGIACWGVEV